MLELADRWTWDFWIARDGADYHAFYLQAPRLLVREQERHLNATVGHAVSRDLRSWTILPDALGPGQPGAVDDAATWTGSILGHAGRWYLYYTGIRVEDGLLVQRVCLAVSDDLTHWEKHPDNPIAEADDRWYELVDDHPPHRERHWRDPWVYPDPGGEGFHMLITARVPTGGTDGRAVIAGARSHDLVQWTVGPPVTAPGDYAQMEVPQVVTLGPRSYLLFSVSAWAHSATRLGRGGEAVSGTHYLTGPTPLGPWTAASDRFLVGQAVGPLYAGKIIEDPDGAPVFLAFHQYAEDGGFLGQLSDPIPVRVDSDGGLALDGEGLRTAVAVGRLASGS